MKKFKYKKILTKDFLIQEYVKNKKTGIKIAKELGINKTIVYKYLRMHNIKIRTISESCIGRKATIEARLKNSLVNSGKLNSQWKDGRTIKKYYCKEPYCDNEINWQTAVHGDGRCVICYHNFNRGKNNPMYGRRGKRAPRYGTPASHGQHSKYKGICMRSRCVICYHNFNRGKNNPMYGRRGKRAPRYGTPASHGQHSKYKGICMRSSWEISYAKYLDKNNIKWVYEPKAFEIIYEYKGKLKEGTYRPDFYLPETDGYIEIKGYWRDDAKIKFEAFKEQHSNLIIQVLMKKDLLEIGVLK
jgi:hypothetical protein